MKTTLSLSGGKDSTFLLLELIRRGTPPDECVFFDTGWEFPQMYRHMDRLRALCEENGIEFTVLHPAKSFDYLMFEKPVREKTGGTHCGYSWCGARGIRWGTTEKTKALDQHNKGNIVLIGIAADEPDRLTKERAPGKTFPLAEWGITETECLAGCYAAGYWAEAGRMLGASDGESDYELLSGGSGTAVVYDLSGLSFSPQIKVEGDTDEDALIRKLRDLEPEFIDFILEALSRREGGAYVTADSRLY